MIKKRGVQSASSAPSTSPQLQRPRARARGEKANTRDRCCTLLTPEVQAGICAAIEKSVPLKYAALANGIAERTMHEWLQRGKRGESPFAEFVVAVECAKGKAVEKLTDRALAGGPGSAQATFLLERRYREEYGPAQRIEHAGSIGLPLAQNDRIAEAIRKDPRALDAVQSIVSQLAQGDVGDLGSGVDGH